jgi:hypothetical protein
MASREFDTLIRDGWVLKHQVIQLTRSALLGPAHVKEMAGEALPSSCSVRVKLD